MLGFYQGIPLLFYRKAKAFAEALKVEGQGYEATGVVVVNTDAEHNYYPFRNGGSVDEQTDVRPESYS